MTEIERLTKLIKENSDKYYNGEESIPDWEFDSYYDQLMKLDPTNPVLYMIGKDSGSAFKKVKHMMHMFSQQKATHPMQFQDWCRANVRDEYIVQYKCDGSSVELQYVNGQFTKAVSRGDGIIGDDITENIRKAKGVVKNLVNDNFTGAVRGEVVLFHDDFELNCKDKQNCRNAANGIMKRKDSDQAHLLTVIVYDVAPMTGSMFKTEYDKFEFLTSEGFKVVDTMFMSNVDEIIKLRDELSKTRFETVPYDIDGLVIKCPEVDKEDYKRDRPNKQIAFKFVLDELPTVVRDIEWYVNGKSRTPVAVCDPVYLCGTTVKRANLCNPDLISKMGLRIGSTVIMVKRGEIIPKIERVVITPKDCPNVVYPTTCEICGSPLVIEPSRVYCPNNSCPETLKHRINKWCAINKIYGLGTEYVSSLFDTGVVKSVKDLYSDGICERMGQVISPVVSEKICEKLTKELPIGKFIGGYDMDSLGEKTANDIVFKMEINSVEDFVNLDEKKLSYMKGYGQTSASIIKKELDKYKDELLELSKIIKVTFPKATFDSPVSGKTFVFTGALNTMKRNVASDIVVNMGGKVASSISAKVDYLVTNESDSNSTKAKEARKLGIKFITEEEFLALVQ